MAVFNPLIIGAPTPPAPEPVTRKDVNFYDYDGTRLYSYTLAEANELTALPPAPTRDRLTFQEWNYSLAKLQTATRPLDIGATYTPTDGKTRLFMELPGDDRLDLPLRFSQTVSNGVEIEWGDGTSPEIVSGTGEINITHSYAVKGSYEITLEVKSGGLSFSSYLFQGARYSSFLAEAWMSGVTSIGGQAFAGCSSLQTLVIPDGVTSIGVGAFMSCSSLQTLVIPDGATSISASAFYYCQSLQTLVIPDSVTSISDGAFGNCSSLQTLVIPDGVTSIGDSAFGNCFSLQTLVIPDGVTSIGGQAFYYCQSLQTLVIPDSVTSISDGAFYYCEFIKVFNFKRLTPPTLSSTNAFTEIAADAIFQVPAASLVAYQTATNWSTFADRMVGV